MLMVTGQVTPTTCGSVIQHNGLIPMAMDLGITLREPTEISVLMSLVLLIEEMLQDVSIPMETAMLIPMMYTQMNQHNGGISTAMDTVTTRHLALHDPTIGLTTQHGMWLKQTLHARLKTYNWTLLEKIISLSVAQL